jgi:hypothetical protein
LVSLRVLAHPPRFLPVPAWKAFVSTSLWFGIDDDIVKLRWMKPMTLTIARGEHVVKFFHELGTLSARTASAQLSVAWDLDLHYYSRFFPFRRGTIVGERHYRDERQPPARY